MRFKWLKGMALASLLALTLAPPGVHAATAANPAPRGDSVVKDGTLYINQRSFENYAASTVAKYDQYGLPSFITSHKNISSPHLLTLRQATAGSVKTVSAGTYNGYELADLYNTTHTITPYDFRDVYTKIEKESSPDPSYNSYTTLYNYPALEVPVTLQPLPAYRIDTNSFLCIESVTLENDIYAITPASVTSVTSPRAYYQISSNMYLSPIATSNTYGGGTVASSANLSPLQFGATTYVYSKQTNTKSYTDYVGNTPSVTNNFSFRTEYVDAKGGLAVYTYGTSPYPSSKRYRSESGDPVVYENVSISQREPGAYYQESFPGTLLSYGSGPYSYSDSYNTAYRKPFDYAASENPDDGYYVQYTKRGGNTETYRAIGFRNRSSISNMPTTIPVLKKIPSRETPTYGYSMYVYRIYGSAYGSDTRVIWNNSTKYVTGKALNGYFYYLKGDETPDINNSYYDGYTQKTTSLTVDTITTQKVNSVVMSNITATCNMSSSIQVELNGGMYTGKPALNGSTTITITKGTITDLDSSVSKFMVGPESESTIVRDGTNTITTVKLSNPPVIIDWADFPGIDLDIDLNAPTIEVTRSGKTASGSTTSSTVTPVSQVTLTVRASDPDGHDSPTPISINGGAFQASGATLTVTENQVVTIVARDANGNTRTFNVDISNIDMSNPEVRGLTSSNTQWTVNPVTVTAEAWDDVKLHATAYRWEFTPNSNTANKTTSSWGAAKTYQVSENGTLRVQVRDSMAKTSDWSDPFYVTNIDKIAPTATVTYSVTGANKVNAETGVTVQVNINDVADAVTKLTSGLSTQPVCWDTTNNQWSDKLEKTFHENGTYHIKVRDALNNQSSQVTVTINQIVGADKKPVITSFAPTAGYEWQKAPAEIKVTATAGAGMTLDARSYSWDNGRTWTSIANLNVYSNGEYVVQVRDTVGNITEASLVMDKIDAYAPTAAVFLYKGAPADWDYATNGDPEIADYVWKVRVEADDMGSGIDHIETMWDGGTHSTLPIIQEIEEPGVYGVNVYDVAGNRTYVEKVVTGEAIGQGAGGGGAGSDAYIDIKVPSTGSGGNELWSDGTSLQDLIHTKVGILNNGKTPAEFKNYLASQKGISVNLVFTGKRNNWVSGYATFNGVRYPVTFPDASGGEIVKATGRQQDAKVFIPIDSVTQDIKNGRIKVVFQEWSEQAKTTLVREGSATLYTSVQISNPNVSWTYNRTTDQISVTGTSTVAGIDPSEIKIDVGSGYQVYNGPTTVGSADPVKIRVTDRAGNRTDLQIPAADLQSLLSGIGGGSLTPIDISSLPNGGAGINSYHMSNRAADIYIIGGVRGNTNSVPPGEIYDAAG